MIKHRWQRLEEDIRRTPLEKRRMIDVCVVCDLHRAWFPEDKLWYYGLPYKSKWTRKRPDCTGDKLLQALRREHLGSSSLPDCSTPSGTQEPDL